MMKRLLVSLPILFLVACGGKEAHDSDENHGENGQTEANHKDGEDGDEGHGEAHALGNMKAHGREFSIIQLGDITAGEEGAIEIKFASAAERIATTRAWVGTESGEGSMKAKLDLEGLATLHGHLEVPTPIPSNSQLWISFDIDGKVETHSIAFKQ